MKFSKLVFTLAFGPIFFALVSSGQAQPYALNLLDHPPPGTLIAFDDFENRPLSSAAPKSAGILISQILSGDLSVNGSKALVATSTGDAASSSIFYTTPDNLLQTGRRYRVLLDYRILKASPPDNTACLLLKSKQAWSPSLVKGSPGTTGHAAYEFIAQGPHSNFEIGLVGPGQIAVDNVRVEELPLIALTPDSSLPKTTHPVPLRDHVGICVHLAWPYFYKTDDEVRHGLDRVQDLGVTWFRDGIGWSTLFPKPGWQPDPVALHRADLTVDEALKRHIRFLCILGGTPEWALGPHLKGQLAWKLPPAKIADYERYVRFVAERYRGKIGAWEIYNEPNGGFWDAPFESYLAEVRAAGTVLHEVDPKNIVVSGGLVEAGLLDVAGARRQPYLDLLKSENARFYDAFGFHSYAGDPMTLYMINAIAERMKANGTTKPIWITETGFSVVGNRTEQQQAEVIPARIKLLLRDPLVENVFIYNLRMKTFQKDPAEAGYGLLHYDFSPRPAFTSLQELLKSAFLQKDPAIPAADGL